MEDQPGFGGLRVAAFESRMATEMTRLIRKHGGEPLVAPALREVPLEDHHDVFTFGTRLLGGELDIVVLLTGVGFRYLMEVLQTRHPLDLLKQALTRATLVVRGPKPVAALREFGLAPTITVPEPNTWRELLQVLDEHKTLRGQRIAVQEYGSSNPDLLEGLRQRGAHVMPVPVYRWALPEDLTPLKDTLRKVLAGEIDVLLVTNAAQVDHIMKVLSAEEGLDAFRDALKRMVVASIGPTATESLAGHGLPIDLEPSHPKMGILVKETSEQAADLLAKKRRCEG